MRPSEALARHRDAMIGVLSRYPVSDARIFGSASRGQDTEASDLDILVRVTGPMSYFDLFQLEDDLEAVSGVKIDVRTEEEFSPRILARISRDFRPI